MTVAIGTPPAAVTFIWLHTVTLTRLLMRASPDSSEHVDGAVWVAPQELRGRLAVHLQLHRPSLNRLSTILDSSSVTPPRHPQYLTYSKASASSSHPHAGPPP